MSDFKFHLPQELYTSRQVRELERIAIEELHVPAFSLMKKAGTAAFNLLLERWPQTRHLIVCAGAGNNGGDGYIVAGLAAQHGISAEVFQLGDHRSLPGDALKAQQFAVAQGVRFSGPENFTLGSDSHYLRNQTVIIDAILGTGIDRKVTGAYLQAIATINNAEFPVIAIDVPSGLSSDSGQPLGQAVKASCTITFIGMKQGLLTAQAMDYCGEIIYHSLDVPDATFCAPNSPKPASRRLDIHHVRHLLSARAPSSHKGDFGHTVVVGGDYGMGGAAIMAAQAALRSGSGLVSLITRSAHCASALSRCPELMVRGTEDDIDVADLLDKASVIVIGPGLGKSAWSRNLLQMTLAIQVSGAKPLVIDADGLNLLAERDARKSGARRESWILTPHPGEAARLLPGEGSGESQVDRFGTVAQLQSKWGGVVILKGAGSLICSECDGVQELDLCTEGNAGMATAGMGDVLSGIIGAMVAQGFSLVNSARLAVCLHGESGDLAAASGGQRGMQATDLLPFVRQLLNSDR